MRLILLIASLLLLASCATQNYYYDTVTSWDNGHINSLIKHWGKPDQKMRAANGNTMLVYYTKSYHPNRGVSAPPVAMHVNRDGKPVFTQGSKINNNWDRGSLSSVCSAVFHINAKGRIIKTETIGSGCYAGESFNKRLKNPAAKPNFTN